MITKEQAVTLRAMMLDVVQAEIEYTKADTDFGRKAAMHTATAKRDAYYSFVDTLTAKEQ